MTRRWLLMTGLPLGLLLHRLISVKRLMPCTVQTCCLWQYTKLD